jgi:hypothetical protein
LYVSGAPEPPPPRDIRGSCRLDCPSPTNLNRNRVSFWNWNAPSLLAFHVGKPSSVTQQILDWSLWVCMYPNRNLNTTVTRHTLLQLWSTSCPNTTQLLTAKLKLAENIFGSDGSAYMEQLHLVPFNTKRLQRITNVSALAIVSCYWLPQMLFHTAPQNWLTIIQRLLKPVSNSCSSVGRHFFLTACHVLKA